MLSAQTQQDIELKDRLYAIRKSQVRALAAIECEIMTLDFTMAQGRYYRAMDIEQCDGKEHTSGVMMLFSGGVLNTYKVKDGYSLTARFTPTGKLITVGCMPGPGEEEWPRVLWVSELPNSTPISAPITAEEPMASLSVSPGVSYWLNVKVPFQTASITYWAQE